MGFDTGIFNSFDQDWALLTVGPADHFNTMTIGWGGLGTLWGMPVATVYVRPNRYTYEFIEKYDSFTVSFYPEQYRKDLALLGSKSGRDGNKLALTSLIPKMIEGAVTFEQAEQTILCRKIYRQEMDPTVIPESVCQKYYQTEPVHTMYIGQVLSVL